MLNNLHMLLAKFNYKIKLMKIKIFLLGFPCVVSIRAHKHDIVKMKIHSTQKKNVKPFTFTFCCETAKNTQKRIK